MTPLLQIGELSHTLTGRGEARTRNNKAFYLNAAPFFQAPLENRLTPPREAAGSVRNCEVRPHSRLQLRSQRFCTSEPGFSIYPATLPAAPRALPRTLKTSQRGSPECLRQNAPSRATSGGERYRVRVWAGHWARSVGGHTSRLD